MFAIASALLWAAGPSSRVKKASEASPWVLSVAGADPTASAGVYADVRTIEELGARPAAVVTAITVQTGNRLLEVRAVDASLVKRQLAATLASLPIAVVKCGLLPRPATVRAVADALAASRAALVVDPVLRSSAGPPLASASVARVLRERLLPRAALVTANLEEAATLTGMSVDGDAAIAEAARRLGQLGPAAVVVKGGHLAGDPVDFLWYDGTLRRFRGRRIGPRDLHGSGCALASAIAVGLARGLSPPEALTEARRHVRRLLRSAERSGEGAWLRGPLRRRG